jgi:hypothetical protein
VFCTRQALPIQVQILIIRSAMYCAVGKGKEKGTLSLLSLFYPLEKLSRRRCGGGLGEEGRTGLRRSLIYKCAERRPVLRLEKRQAAGRQLEGFSR